LHPPLCCLKSRNLRVDVKLQEQISFEVILLLHILLSFDGIVFYMDSVKICFFDQFNKGGNCELQKIIFIIISKFSKCVFNLEGNCKIQYPKMKGGCVTLHFLQLKFVLLTLIVAKS
jgi:hypothetical protein